MFLEDWELEKTDFLTGNQNSELVYWIFQESEKIILY